MIYAGILAAGLGIRMHRQDLPKPFLPLGSKPMIIHTLEQFFMNQRLQRIIIVVHNDWITYTQDLLAQYSDWDKECCVIPGGRNKSESMYEIVKFIRGKWDIGEEDILIAHDAIRPFITGRLINDNIETAIKYGAANTAMPTNDALLESHDGKKLESVPTHEHLYAEQTPQTYKLPNLIKVFDDAREKNISLASESELPRLYIKSGFPMYLVHGEYFNMKIINPYDLEVAEALLKERQK